MKSLTAAAAVYSSQFKLTGFALSETAGEDALASDSTIDAHLGRHLLLVRGSRVHVSPRSIVLKLYFVSS